ncbi:hypothetical protein NEF87_003481 [Candidatus Lokiarchaeum ossiferum]|uniref:7TM-DISM receptor extracellular domain-containing protein n=1 Tax=Candidatus Lokiarchaeum ossiferum TaxID=2951803 RepID=A0ABY6HUW0_9ARCH|nr:hypothetical protein NEF87_003481 [Candidatus Lokiarchaeum sp. B-35]
MGSPGEDNEEGAHSDGWYSIFTNSSRSLDIIPEEHIFIDILVKGPGVILKFHPDVLENQFFTVYPAPIITDGSDFDSAPEMDEIAVVFEFIAPKKAGVYEILIYGRSPEGPGKPYIADLNFTINVGFAQESNSWFKIDIFNHLNMYLGSVAMISFISGTIIIKVQKRKTYLHGILMSTALVATSINVAFILKDCFRIMGKWIAYDYFDWIYLLHFIPGIIGFGAFFVAYMKGLAGYRNKKSGYLALGCWVLNFIFGIIVWGVNW